MRPERLLAILLAGIVSAALPAAAEVELTRLHKNPFSRPDSARPKPPPPPPPPPAPAPLAAAPQAVVLDLTATLVSETSPLVVVDGEMLGIGDEIEGLRLIAVMEGRAVFERDGKKYDYQVDGEEAE